jgi:hypothetical protein
MHPVLCDQLVRCCLLPKLFYAAPVWASVTSSPSCVGKLDSLLSKACIWKDGLFRSTSVATSLVIGRILPSELQIKLRVGVKYFSDLAQGKDPLHTQVLASSAYFISPLDIMTAERRRWSRTPDLSELMEHIEEHGCTSIILSHAKKLLLSYYTSKWQTQWAQDTAGERLRELQVPVATTSESSWRLSLPRFILSQSFCFATGHANFPAYMSRIHGGSSLCWFCSNIGSRNHLLWECEGLSSLRAQLTDQFGCAWDVSMFLSDTGWLMFCEFVRQMHIRRSAVSRRA